MKYTKRKYGFVKASFARAYIAKLIEAGASKEDAERVVIAACKKVSDQIYDVIREVSRETTKANSNRDYVNNGTGGDD